MNSGGTASIRIALTQKNDDAGGWGQVQVGAGETDGLQVHRYNDAAAAFPCVYRNVWPAPGLQVDLTSWRAQSAAMYPAREHLLRP